MFVDELVVDAVRRKSIAEAEQRAKPRTPHAVDTGRGFINITGPWR